MIQTHIVPLNRTDLSMANVYLSLGSNQGDRLDLLCKATRCIAELIGKVKSFSPVIESEPWGFDAETNFFNLIVLVRTELDPLQVLESVLKIEKSLGRKRLNNTYSSRTIDIDILFYNQSIIKVNELTVPHPRLHMRKFVLEPLAMIAPDFVHPVLKKPISSLLSELKDKNPIAVIVDTEKFAELLATSN